MDTRHLTLLELQPPPDGAAQAQTAKLYKTLHILHNFYSGLYRNKLCCLATVPLTTLNFILLNSLLGIYRLSGHTAQSLPLLAQIYEPRTAALSTKSHPHLKINPANTAQLYGERPVLPGANMGSPLISGGADGVGCALGSSVSYI